MDNKTFGDMIIGNIIGWDKKGQVSFVASSISDNIKEDDIDTYSSQNCGKDCRMDCPDCKDDKCSWDPQ